MERKVHATGEELFSLVQWTANTARGRVGVCPLQAAMGMVPRVRRLTVVGVFDLGLREYNSSYGFVNLDVARRLFRKEQVDLMELRVEALEDAPAVAEAVPATLGSDYLAEDWGQLNSALFSALWLEKMAIGITIGLIIMVAALNIVASLVLLVMEKSRDIAILKTIGAG